MAFWRWRGGLGLSEEMGSWNLEVEFERLKVETWKTRKGIN